MLIIIRCKDEKKNDWSVKKTAENDFFFTKLHFFVYFLHDLHNKFVILPYEIFKIGQPLLFTKYKIIA